MSAAPAPATPDVSVVVIVFNDAARLPRAVASALDQSLGNVEVVVVDDASTDDSHRVALELAALHPGRVRAVRLQENSGGCSRPRNVGIEHARGTYVMFLDSDDTLDPHACRNMLAAAEDTGADLVSGLCLRVHVNRLDKTTPWYPWLYEHRAVYESLADQPDLLYDTLSTNKCYRRDFLVDNDLRFPEGLHYEDLLFSARAYLAARRITLIPNTVYHWNVVSRTDNLSISNRRDEIRNFADRVRIHELIDEQLALHAGDAADDLKLHKDTKFLKHDLVLYLRRLPFQDAAHRAEFTRIARGYLATLHPGAFTRAGTVQGLCGYLLMRDDWAALVPAIDLLQNPKTLGSPLIERGGRVFWGAGRAREHLADELGARVLDITGLGLETGPLGRVRPGNLLTSFSASPDGRTARLTGTITVATGLLPETADLSARIRLKPRRKLGRDASFPVRELRRDGDRLRWAADLPLSADMHPVGLLDPVWDLEFTLNVDGKPVRGHVMATDLPDEPPSFPVRPTLGRLTADHVEAHITAKGALAFLLTQHGAAARRSVALAYRALDSDVTARAAARLAPRRKQLKRVKRHAKQMLFDGLARLPVKKGLVVFESHLGKQFSDNPKYIYEEMRRAGVEFEAVWSYADSPKGFPKDAVLVKRDTWKYYKALAQAEFWIDNQGIPQRAVKNPGTTYIQTWHGTALKRMGFDMPSMKRASLDEATKLRDIVERFDYFVVRSEHDVRTLLPAYELQAEPLRVGYPRNDALLDPSSLQARTAALRDELGLTGDPRRIVLYAPTFRAGPGGGVAPFRMPFDVGRFAREFGDRYVLLVRTHYLNDAGLTTGLHSSVRDAGQVADITELLLISDALITDYSSLMFDYALLDRPLVLFAYDYDAYAHQERGAYFDLRAHAPGPLVEDEDALFGVLARLDETHEQHRGRHKRFVEEFGEYDHGNAAKAIVERFFTPGAGR